MADRIQVRRDTDADWTSNDPTLAAGELGFVSDTNKLVVGDGSTAFTSLEQLDVGPSPLVRADDTVTLYVGNEQTITASSFHTLLDIAGPVVLLGGTFYGINGGVRLTIDGTVVFTDNSQARGDDLAGNLFDVWHIPAGYAASTLKIEGRNTGGTSRDYGWTIRTKTV